MKKEFSSILLILALGGTAFFLLNKKPKVLVENTETKTTLPPPDIATDTAVAFKAFTSAGIRNNNPLNIEYNAANNWVGQTGRDGRWVVFSSPEYGFRAGAKLLDTYAAKYGLKNITSIINRFAPISENPNNQSYINYVSRRVGIPPFANITRAQYPKILEAMGKFESGKEWGVDTVNRGMALL